MKGNLVELKIENTKTGGWRKVVVPCGLTLFNLHRIVQYSFMKSVARDAAIEKMAASFSLKGGDTWTKAGQLKNATLEVLPSGAEGGQQFLKGRKPLTYTAGGGVTYSITAGKRAVGDATSYVPRCIAGSEEAQLDKANKKMLTSRFAADQTRNRQKKKPPALYCPPHTPAKEIWESHMSAMRDPVGSG